MNLINILLILVVIVFTAYLMMRSIQKKQNAEIDEKIEVDEKTYNIDKMTEFIKRRKSLNIYPLPVNF